MHRHLPFCATRHASAGRTDPIRTVGPARPELFAADYRRVYVLEGGLGEQGRAVGGVLPLADVWRAVCPHARVEYRERQGRDKAGDRERGDFCRVQPCTYLHAFETQDNQADPGGKG